MSRAFFICLAALAVFVCTFAPGARAKPRISAGIASSLSVKKPVYGSWENIDLEWSLTNVAKKPIIGGDGDVGCSLRGRLVRLTLPSGRVRTWGWRRASLKKNPPRFLHGKRGRFPRGEYMTCGREETVQDMFGPLAPGSYKLQVIVPAGRFFIKGRAPRRYASNIVRFKVIQEDKARSMRALDSALQPFPGVALEVEPTAKHGVFNVTIVNNADSSLYYSGRDDASAQCAAFYGGALQTPDVWHGFAVNSCISQGIMELGPRSRRTYVVALPRYERDHRYVRFLLAPSQTYPKPTDRAIPAEAAWVSSIGVMNQRASSPRPAQRNKEKHPR